MQKKSFLINNKGDSMESRGRKAFKRAERKICFKKKIRFRQDRRNTTRNYTAD